MCPPRGDQDASLRADRLTESVETAMRMLRQVDHLFSPKRPSINLKPDEPAQRPSAPEGDAERLRAVNTIRIADRAAAGGDADPLVERQLAHQNDYDDG
jgi:hypothetical protein